MSRVLPEVFDSASARNTDSHPIVSANPGARRSVLYAVDDTSRWCPLSAEKVDVAPDSGAPLGQLSLAGLMTANPAARRSELYAGNDASQLYPLSAEKAGVAPDSGGILGQLSFAGLLTANPGARHSEVYAVEDAAQLCPLPAEDGKEAEVPQRQLSLAD